LIDVRWLLELCNIRCVIFSSYNIDCGRSKFISFNH